MCYNGGKPIENKPMSYLKQHLDAFIEIEARASIAIDEDPKYKTCSISNITFKNYVAAYGAGEGEIEEWKGLLVDEDNQKD